MSTVIAVEAKSGVSQQTGKPWTRYDATLDDGRVASGFTFVTVGDTVNVVAKGQYLNYTKVSPVAHAATQTGSLPIYPVPPVVNNGQDRSSRIERQHSQEMALRYATLKGLNALSSQEFRKLIDWFQRDVGHVPGQDIIEDAKEIFNATESPKPDDEPF